MMTFGLLLPTLAWACPTCPTGVRTQVAAGIVDTARIGVVAATLPLAFFSAAVALGWAMTSSRRRAWHGALTAGAVLGAGLAGLLDGLLFHQILQWHALISARLPPDTLVAAKVNMFWDGIFHAGMWLTIAVGGVLLARTVRAWGDRRAALAGGLIGAGAFNLCDGVINHQLLGSHHLIDGLIWPDGIYLSMSALILLVGWLCRPRATATTTEG